MLPRLVLLAIAALGSSCVYFQNLITTHGMSKQAKSESESAPGPDSLAHEIGNLYKHFTPISFSAGMDAGTANLPSGSGHVCMGQVGDTIVDRRSPLPLDDAFVQQTKDQIRSIVESIAGLANSPIEPKAFLSSALSKILQAMGANGAALWEHLPDAQWRLVGEIGLPKCLIGGNQDSALSLDKDFTDPEKSSFEQLDLLEVQLHISQSDGPAKNQSNERTAIPSPAHLALLNAVAAERQPILIPPCEVALSRERPANPTDDILIYAPLTVPKEQGSFWLQVLQSPSGGPASQRGYLRFVAQMADLLSDYFRSHRLRMFERDQACLKLAEQTMNELSTQPIAKLGLAGLMNTLRSQAQSEHAFLLHRKSQRGKWRVCAAAGLVVVDRRAEGISLTERVSAWIQSTFPGECLVCTEDRETAQEQRDPEFKLWVNALSVSKFAWIKPLQTDSNPTDLRLREDVAVLLTWSADDNPSANCREQCRLIARLGLSSLQLPWWKAARLASRNLSPSRFAMTDPANWHVGVRWIAGLSLLTLVLVIPVPIRLHATAVLVPMVQQHIYAPVDCVVDEVLVQHGQNVKAGEPLLRLRSATLTAEYDQTMSQQLRNAQRLSDIEARLLRETSLKGSQRDELEGEREAIGATRRIEQAILARLQAQMDSMQIVASFDGVVATWNVQENLHNRPLRTGQLLMSVHDAASPWILEAALTEQDGHDFHIAIKNSNELAFATMTGSPQHRVHVRYRPDSSRMERVPQTSAGDATAMLRVQFDVDSLHLPAQSASAGATARITIPSGHGPLIWALGKDFVQRTWAKLQMWV
jgi:hypothetical protein